MGRANGRGSSGAALAIVALGLGLAAASGSLSNGGGTTASSADAVIFGAIGLVVTAVAVAVGWRAMRHSITPAVRRAAGAGAIVIITLGGLTALASAPSTSDAPAVDESPENGVGSSADAGAEGRAAIRPPDERDRTKLELSDLEGTIYLSIGLGLLVAAIVVFARRSELRTVDQAPVYLATSTIDSDDADVTDDDVADALRSSLEQMGSSDDPRSAIRAAYATLLAQLATIGLERRAYEAPGEYIGRCLSGRELPEPPMCELLELFSLARFSHHEITCDHADAARRALQQSIDALTVTSST